MSTHLLSQLSLTPYSLYILAHRGLFQLSVLAQVNCISSKITYTTHINGCLYMYCSSNNSSIQDTTAIISIHYIIAKVSV